MGHTSVTMVAVALQGSSGVVKSTMINALAGSESQKTAEVHNCKRNNGSTTLPRVCITIPNTKDSLFRLHSHRYSQSQVETCDIPMRVNSKTEWPRFDKRKNENQTFPSYWSCRQRRNQSHYQLGTGAGYRPWHPLTSETPMP